MIETRFIKSDSKIIINGHLRIKIFRAIQEFEYHLEIRFG